MRRLVAASILVCCIGALGHTQSEQGKNESSHKQEQTTSNTANSASSTQAALSPEPSVTDKNTEGNERSGNHNLGNREGLIRRITDARITSLAMVILTLAYVLVTAFLLLAVRRQVEIATSGERAWLFEYDIPTYRGPDKANPDAMCWVNFKNFGKSPAWIVSVSGSFQWVDSDNRLKPIYEPINWGDVVPVPPGEKQNFAITKQIGERKENSRLAVFVSVEYRDRFNLASRSRCRRMRYSFISTNSSIGSAWIKTNRHSEYS
jgi:hypothetical protein